VGHPGNPRAHERVPRASRNVARGVSLRACDVDPAPGTALMDLLAAQSAMQTGPTIRRIHDTRRSPREP
jgi:hypothetical protein